RILRPRRHDKAPEDVKEPPPSLVTVEPEEPDEGVRVLTPDASEPSASNGASADAEVEPAPVADIIIANETVTDLFARIKADRAEAVAKAQEVLAEAERETPRPDAETEATVADAVGAGAGQVVAGDDTDAVELADDLAAELVGELRQRLEAALADVEGSGEDGEGPPDDADVVDRIGAAYRQWKSQRVEALA